MGEGAKRGNFPSSSSELGSEIRSPREACPGTNVPSESLSSCSVHHRRAAYKALQIGRLSPLPV